MNMRESPIIGITMGDPAGIGPEIILKACCDARLFERCRPIIVGNVAAMRKTAGALGMDVRLQAIDDIGDAIYRQGTASILEIPDENQDGFRLGEISAASGDLAFACIRKAIALALDGEIDAVTTAPIHKESLRAAGHAFAGHTEIFSHYTRADNVGMLLAEGNLRVIHVSTHVSLRQACDLVTRDRVASVIRLLYEACRDVGIASPRLGVAGLNPHASDGGLFGHEESQEIMPAIVACRAEGIVIEGPLPADTMFAKAAGGYFDGCVAMYHDQGHIPLKTAGFSWDNQRNQWKEICGVNVTLGIPIIRTSVDHGTAFDIAGTGVANHSSLLHAIDYAARMAVHRQVKEVR